MKINQKDTKYVFLLDTLKSTPGISWTNRRLLIPEFHDVDYPDKCFTQSHFGTFPLKPYSLKFSRLMYTIPRFFFFFFFKVVILHKHIDHENF